MPGSMYSSEVKSVCDNLEISPSAKQKTSPIYNKGSQPQAKAKSAGKASEPSAEKTSRKKEAG